MTALPVNIKAEQAVIGALLRSESEFWKVSNILRVDHFHAKLHREIYQAIQNICLAGQKLSMTLLGARLPEETEDGASMATTLAVLARNAEEVGSPLDFVDEVVDAWTRRRLIKIAEETHKAARDRTKVMADVLPELESALLDVSRRSEANSEESLKTILERVVNHSADAFEDQFIPGFDTGLPSMDEILGRVMPGDFGVIGGGVGEFKTALATQFLWRFVEPFERVVDGERQLVQRPPVLMIQQEMPSDDIVRRILAGEAEMSVSTIEEGAFNFDEFDRLKAAERRIAERGLFIHAQPRMRCSQIRSRAIAMKRERGLGGMVVDSLKRTLADTKVRDVFERVDYVTSYMKALALELEIPIIALSHRTRQSQDRDDPRPRTTDFFGGGSIEENADWILGLWVRERWLQQRRPSKEETQKMDKWAKDIESCRGLIEAICLKRRRGDPMKEAKFRINGRATKLEELR